MRRPAPEIKAQEVVATADPKELKKTKVMSPWGYTETPILLALPG